jgi:hypothetical protein
MTQPLPGSRIDLARVGPDEQLTLPVGGRGVLVYGMALFLLAWLGMWTMGFASAATQVAAGEGGAFLMFWLAGWTVGGAFALWTLYRMLRPVVPEGLLLRRDGVLYDSGVPPYEVSFNLQGQRDFWKQAFRRRIVRQIDAATLESLALRETGEGNRLTVDVGVERIELAATLTEVEREWLHRFLVDRYRLRT